MILKFKDLLIRHRLCTAAMAEQGVNPTGANSPNSSTFMQFGLNLYTFNYTFQ